MSEAIVHVVDDDEAMRDSLAFLLRSGGLSPRTYDGGPAFLQGLRPHTSGCLLTDVRMPDMNGLDLVRQIKEHRPDFPIIVITGHGDVPLAVEAMKAGVLDFLEKPFDDEKLLSAVKAALDHEAHRSHLAPNPAFATMLAGLSPRETEVLQGVLAGKQNKVIALDLGISPRTVEVYRANVMTKTGAGSLSELVRMAMLAGF